MDDALDTVLYAVMLVHFEAVPSALPYNLALTYSFSPSIISAPGSVFGCVYSGSALSSWSLNVDACISLKGGRIAPVVARNSNTSYTFTIGTLQPDERFHAVMTGTVIQAVQPQDVLSNPVVYTYRSSPLSLSSGRQYSVSPTITTTVPAPSLAWAMVWSADPLTIAPSVSIEENFALMVTVTMPESITNTSVVISIPGNTIFLSATVNFIGQNIHNSSIVVGQADAVNTVFGYSSLNNCLTALFGVITNVADNVQTTADTIQVRNDLFLWLVAIILVI